MGDQRTGGIAWTDETWNPIRGCSKVSPGCANCYAETMAARFCGHGGPYEGLIENGRWNGKVHLVAEHLNDPLRWRRPRRVFVNSMSDLFHEDLAEEVIDQVFARMAMAPRHTFQVLTKRASRMADYLKNLDPERIYHSCLDPHGVSTLTLISGHHLHWKLTGKAAPGAKTEAMENLYGHATKWPLPNVWLGVTVENQETAEERIPLLLESPAALRWISIEPLLGPVDLDLPRCETHGRDELSKDGSFCNECAADGWSGELAHGEWLDPLNEGIAWVVVGGESGPHARPLHPDWARGLRDQCAAAGVPFLFKQWGEWGPSAVHMASGESVFRVFRDFQHWEAKGHTWMSKGDIVLDATGRRCHTSGQLMEGQAPFTVLRKIGRETAGRLLDGRLHDAYPEPIERVAEGT